MSLTARQLNRATLARQLLLRREPLGAAEAVHRLVALQAQEPASPYLALWNRICGFDPAGLDAAFTVHQVVKASLLRLTLHVVHAEDWAAFHTAMLPSLRASRLRDRRFVSTGLSIADADALVSQVVSFASRPRTGSEIEQMLATQLGAGKPRVWWALRMFAPLHHAPTGGPWSFDRPSSFVAAPGQATGESHEDSVSRLVLRYLRAFGPASAQDFAQFTMLRQPVVTRALRVLAGKVEEVAGPDGARLYDLPGAPVPGEDTAAPPRLLPMWDGILLAYADRSRVVPPEYRPLVFRRTGDVLPTLLVDGQVAGVWRPAEGGIEAAAFHRLADQDWQGLAEEARALVAFLADREPAVYRRYEHWWDKGLPVTESRVLPG